MSTSNLPNHDLRELLRELAAADAPDLIARARTRARAKAERLIEETLVEELLGAAAALRQSPPANGAPAVSSPVQDSRAAPEASPAAASASDGGDAWWAYCILWEQDAGVLAPQLEGIETGSCVEAICDGPLAALVSPVPLSEYGDERLRAHLEDLDWLERTARAHEGVLEATLREATIVPLRLCTLYRDRDGVRRLLREHRVALKEELSRVDGCFEWGVKLFADPNAQTSDAPSEADRFEGRGATYLLRRQQERALAERAGEVRARCAEVVHQRVAALARASTTNPPQRPELHGRELAMLLNGAYLVERNRTGELEDTVATLQEEWRALGFTIDLTGPWPPYNFVSGAAGVMS